MGTALPFIMAGLSIVQGVSGYIQNQNAASDARANADATIQNQQNVLEINRTRQQRTNEQLAGKSRVAAAGSGATLNSFGDVLDDNSKQGLLDVALLEYDSKTQQNQTRYNGAVQSAEYKNKATSSLISGISGAAGSLYGEHGMDLSTGRQYSGLSSTSSDGTTIRWYKH